MTCTPCGRDRADTAALVDVTVANNATWEDAFQFDDPTDTSWTLTGQKFRLDVKGSPEDTVALLTLLSDAGEIVVDDVNLRVIHFNVPDTTIRASLVPGCYFYDLIMYDTSVPPVRVALMAGKFVVIQGITGD